MTNPLAQDLGCVVRLLEKATPGPEEMIALPEVSEKLDRPNERPKLPQEMGQAGENIWAFADALSKAAHRAHEIRQLRESIYSNKNHCGACTKWMKNTCPREKHDMRKGHSVGPSSGAMKCREFQINPSYAILLVKDEERLAQLMSAAIGETP